MNDTKSESETPNSTGIKWSVVNPDRPLPDLTEADSGDFWRSVQEQRLTYPVCDKCGTVVFYPRGHCTRCLSLDLTVQESTGTGSVYAFTVIRHNPHPAFKAMLPYVVALVDLDEGFRMWTHLSLEPEEAELGMRVQVSWETSDGFVLPVFVRA